MKPPLVSSIKAQSAAAGRRVHPLLKPLVWWALLREAVAGWLAHGMSTQGAALAYYSLFALGPVMLISISIAGLVFGPEARAWPAERRSSPVWWASRVLRV